MKKRNLIANPLRDIDPNFTETVYKDEGHMCVSVDHPCDDHITVDMTLINGIDSGKAIEAKFFQQRTSIILDSPHEWNVAISRFLIDTSSIPLFIAPEDGTYRVTLTYLGTDYSQDVIYTPLGPAFDSPRYYFSINHFLDDINRAWQAAFIAAGSPGALVAAPYYIYNNDSKQIGLVVHANYASNYPNNSSLSPVAEVWVNYRLYDKLQGAYVKESAQFLDTAVDKAFRYTTFSNGINNITPRFGSPAGTYLVNYQDAFTNLADIQSIIVYSDSLPIIRGQFAQNNFPSTFQQGVNTASNSQSIISDFNIDLDSFTTTSTTQQLTYSANLYRFFSMMGTTALSSVDFRIAFTDRSGNVQPIFLAPGRIINIKLMFVRKGLAS